MKTYAELKALIEQRGVHPEFGDVGAGWGIEQNPHELATFLCRMQELGVQSVLEIGTGYKGGLSRFLAADMGWDVTTVDVQDYGHRFAGVEYIILRSFEQFYFGVDERFDVVFIDGHHSYDSVIDDYTAYHAHANKVIAFHDIAGLRDCEGVEKFWILAEFPVKRHHVLDKGDRRSGIGWIEL